MSGDDSSDRGLSRRAVLASVGGLSGALSMVVTGQSNNLGGDLTAGGSMSLNQAFNVAGDLFIGPDSERSNTSPEAGRVYVASDTQVRYYGDGSSWTKMGIGSPQESVPAINTEQLDSVRYASQFAGADGGEQIQAALNDLPGKGGKVVIGPNGPDSGGKWIYSSPINIPVDNVLIEGAGMSATTLKQADGADAEGFIIPTDRTDVTIRAMEMDGNRRNQSLDSLSNHVQLILAPSGAERIHVENIYAHDAVNNFFNTERDESNRHKHISIKNCFLDNNYDPSVDDPSTEYRPAEDLIEFKTTDYCTVSGCWLSGAWKAGVEMERTKHCSITNNIAQKTAYRDNSSAFRVEGADDTGTIVSENITIANNAVKNVKDRAISISAGKDVVVSENVMQDVPSYAVIAAENYSVRPQNISVTGNVIRPNNNTAYGIQFARCDDSKIADNIVFDADNGISVDSSSHIDITDNQVRNVTARGLIVNNGSGAHDIRGNRVRLYSQDSNTTVDGFDVRDADCTVKDNRVAYSSAGAKAYNVSGANCTFEDNWTDASGVATAYRSPNFVADTEVRGNSPRVDAHRGQSDGDSDNAITVTFNKPYASRPALNYGRVGGGINGVSFTTDGSGNYDGVTLTIGTAGGTVDVFAESAV